MDLPLRKSPKSFPQLNWPVSQEILEVLIRTKNLRIPQRRRTRSKSAIT